MKKYILIIALLVTSLAFSQGGYTKPVVTAINVTIADAGAIITATEVENALQENRIAINLNTPKDTNVSTDLTTTHNASTVVINSSDGTDATINAATATTAGIMSEAIYDEHVVNNGKTTNATHTGEVTGATALTVDATAISNKTTVTPVATDMLLLWDATDSALKKVDATDFLGAGIAHLEWNDTDKTVWNNGKGNIPSNTSFGDNTLKTNTTGSNNTAIGQAAMLANTTGDDNTAIGVSSLISNTEGLSNTAIGVFSLVNNTEGFLNTAIGLNSMAQNITGERNTSLGYSSLSTNTIGSNNTALGYNANVGSNNLTNVIVIGNGATVSASNTVVIGNASIIETYLKGVLSIGIITDYADNAAALSGGLVVGQVYRTADVLKIVH